MVELFNDYLPLSVAELIYALLLSISIFLSIYFFYRARKTDKEVNLLNESLNEASLDRASFIANTALHTDSIISGNEILDVEKNTNRTLLQQELENYLLREQESGAFSEQNFVNTSADFIDFLKIKSGKIVLTEISFRLDELLDTLEKRLRSQLARTQIELIFDIDTKIPPNLYGDSRHIGLLLFHLLSNIIHQHTSSQLILHVKSQQEADNILRLHLYIEECDLGNKLLDSNILFQPFSDSTLDDHMCLELYVSRELARMMKGDITVDRRANGKNLFSIVLLIAEIEPNERRYYRLPSRSMLGQKILMVEENSQLAESIKTMYTYFKNEVTVITLSDLVKDFDQIKMYKTVVIEKEFLQLPVTEKFRSIKNAYKVNVVVLITAKDELNYTFPVGAVDQLLVKPVTIQRVFNSIISLEERVDLPVMSKALKESANTQFNENFNQKVFEDFLGKRILLIENDKNNQQNILSLLGHSGINLSLANNMQESLLMLDKPGTFDLILLAAEVDGEEKLPLSRRIRHLNRYKGVPIIIMGVENKKVEVPGTDEVLTRPVAAGALYALFNHYLCVDEALFEKESVTLSQIAFINTVSLAARDGLEMASYDETLYKEILKEFMELYSDSDTQMNNVLVKDDLEALKELCLDIKGVAANIGAYNLADIAAKIHAAISNGMERHLMGLIQSYQPELEKVRDEIAAYLKS